MQGGGFVLSPHLAPLHPAPQLLRSGMGRPWGWGTGSGRHAFIHSVNRCLQGTHDVPSSILGTGDLAEDTVKSSPLWSLHSGKKGKQQTDTTLKAPWGGGHTEETWGGGGGGSPPETQVPGKYGRTNRASTEMWGLSSHDGGALTARPQHPASPCGQLRRTPPVPLRGRRGSTVPPQRPAGGPSTGVTPDPPRGVPAAREAWATTLPARRRRPPSVVTPSPHFQARLPSVA